MAQTPPTTDQIRLLLQEAGHPAAALPVEHLGTGYDVWAFRAGDTVIRVLRDPETGEHLVRETAATQYLAPLLPLPIPQLRLHKPAASAPFTTHTLISGVPLQELRRPPAPNLGQRLGAFIRALHEVPTAPLEAAGVAFVPPASDRQRTISRFEEMAPSLLPLLSCEARTYTLRVVQEYLNNPAAFEYEPVATHGDIDNRNVLADPETGELTGVIDFGDIEIGNPATDVEGPYCGNFASLGISDQLPALLHAAGVPEALVAARSEFMPVWWSLQDLRQAQTAEDSDALRQALESLNQIVPFGTHC